MPYHILQLHTISSHKPISWRTVDQWCPQLLLFVRMVLWWWEEGSWGHTSHHLLHLWVKPAQPNPGPVGAYALTVPFCSKFPQWNCSWCCFCLWVWVRCSALTSATIICKIYLPVSFYHSCCIIYGQLLCLGRRSAWAGSTRPPLPASTRPILPWTSLFAELHCHCQCLVWLISL